MILLGGLRDKLNRGNQKLAAAGLCISTCIMRHKRLGISSRTVTIRVVEDITTRWRLCVWVAVIKKGHMNRELCS